MKEHVKAVMNVIDDAKKKQLDEAEKKAEMNVYKQLPTLKCVTTVVKRRLQPLEDQRE